MATPQQPPEAWYEAVIDLMVHERIPLLMAATRLGIFEIPITPEEAAAHERRKCFREMLRAAQNRMYAAEASGVKEKDLVLGRMARNAGTLVDMGKPKEANDSLAAIAKINGWNSPETVINNFESPAQIEEVRRQLEAKLRDELARKHPVQ